MVWIFRRIIYNGRFDINERNISVSHYDFEPVFTTTNLLSPKNNTINVHRYLGTFAEGFQYHQ